MTNPLVIESIEVRRAPGIPDGFSLPTFGGGINVITGPNASGKSTTAQLLHQLFWKQETHGDAHLEVRFRYCGDAWTLRRDGHRIVCHCNGEAKPQPVFDELTDDTRDRYLLALHDLLKTDDVAFARTIAREAAGGFDLDAAAKSLNYHARPSSPQKLKEQLERARIDLHRMQGQQEALAGREAILGEHHEQAQLARAADSELNTLNQIELALDAERQRNAACRALEVLPEALSRFRGDELHRLQELLDNETDLLVDRNRIEQQIGLLSVALQELRLPAAPDLDIAIDAMTSHLKALETAEQSGAIHERDRQAALQKRDLAIRGLASLLDPTDAVAQAVELLDDLADALSRLEQAARSDEMQREIAAWIGVDEPPIDLERIEEGIRALQSWLRAPDPTMRQTDGFKWLLVVALIFLLIEAVLLGLMVHPAGFALLFVPLMMAAILSRQRPAAIDRRQEAMDRFARLGLANPREWRVEDVEQVLDHLQYQVGAGVVQREKALRWSDLSRKRVDAERLRADTRAEVEALKARFGISRELSAQSSAFAGQALREALSAESQARDAAGRLLAMQHEQRDSLMAFNRQGELVRIAAATDAAHAAALMHELQDRIRQSEELRHLLEIARRKIDEQLLPALAAIERERAALRQRTGIEHLDEIALLAGQHDEWNIAKKRLDDAELTLADRRSLLPPDLLLDRWSPERVASERLELQHRASQYEPAMKAINAIEYELNEAKQGQSVERALAAEEIAREALVGRRADDIISALGALVVETVREQSDEANLPVVARKARERFSQITRGRYELKIVPGDRPVFTAIDTISSIEQPLDQLSSATRVQLLLAVRVAFVETNERTAKLPLLLDETLANADESRAEAMIEAAFDLATEGRQLFYFTAQRDEVEKWRAIGADHLETDVTVIDLAAARHIPAQIRTDWLELPRVERVLPPEPDGMSRAHYRALIGVPQVSLWARGEGDLHLWYLVPDLPRLYRLLVADVATWGQLRSYIDQGAGAQLGLSDEEVMQVRAMAKLCAAIREAARSGKGIPVTAAALLASGAISSSYSERCLELLDACDGNAAEFVARLKRKEITGFRADKIEQLEQYFRDSGYIVDGEELEPDALAHRVRIELSPELERGIISVEDINRLILDLALPATSVISKDQPDRIEAALTLPNL